MKRNWKCDIFRDQVNATKQALNWAKEYWKTKDHVETNYGTGDMLYKKCREEIKKLVQNRIR